MEYNIAYDNWASNPMLCTEGVKELREIEDNEEEKKYRFGAELAFGTAGMRGIIGYGPNMMNIYTVRRATKGLCDYVCGLGEKEMTRGVVISYDTRHYSHTFALAAAAVLIQNNIRVYMYGEPRPVPMLSFAVRKLKAVAGIMITASHNPKEYNGYKVYGADGAQMPPDMTAEVVKHIEAITDYFSVKTVDVNSAAEMGAVRTLGPAFERLYYNVVRKQGLSRKAVRATGKHIKIVYTSLHGTGLVPVTSVLKRMGINVTVVGEQKSYDGDFPTVETPNPANPEALKMAVELADRIKADVVFGTDPDSDRLGVAVRNDSGEFVVLTGNQTGALLLEYILMRLKQEKKLPENAVVIKSFVSTNLAKSICRSYGVEILETPVGFKFIGEKIREYEKDKSKTFIFGFEESCGFLRGTHSRDKDAVVASMLFAELACYCAYKEKSVYSMLTDIYERLGYVYDCTEDIRFEGIGAMDEMNAVVDRLRADKLKSVDIFNVGVIRDYLTGERHVISDGEEKEEPEKLEYSGINCIYYEFVSGISVCVRPSGTEPKLKIYYSINGKDEQTCLKTYEKFSGEFEKVLKRAENE